MDGLPGWFRHAYVRCHAQVRVGFKLSAGLGDAWNRDDGIPQGCPLSVNFFVAPYLPRRGILESVPGVRPQLYADVFPFASFGPGLPFLPWPGRGLPLPFPLHRAWPFPSSLKRGLAFPFASSGPGLPLLPFWPGPGLPQHTPPRTQLKREKNNSTVAFLSFWIWLRRGLFLSFPFFLFGWAPSFRVRARPSPFVSFRPDLPLFSFLGGPGLSPSFPFGSSVAPLGPALSILLASQHLQRGTRQTSL